MARPDNIKSPTPGRLPAQGRFVGRMQREYRYYKALLRDPRTPTSAKWLIGGGMSYMLLPFDLIPDFIPIVGKIDDLLIAPSLIGLGMKLVPDGVRQDDRDRSRRIRFQYDDQSEGPVLFESEALPGPFGISIGASSHDQDLQGPVLIPLLDLMFEYGLVVLANKPSDPGKDESDDLNASTIEEPGLCSAQVKLDMNFRPLPLMAGVMNISSDIEGVHRFVNLEAAYLALPKKLKKRIQRLQVRWSPCPEVCLRAVLDDTERHTQQKNVSAHVVSGAQFISLLLNGECSIPELGESQTLQLMAELREFVLGDTVCYTHQPSAGQLISWNPRQILHIAAATSESSPRYIYPRHFSETNLGRR